MTWVRIEDRFTENAKIMELNDAEFRVWLRLLCHCARLEDPTVDAKTRREVAGLTKQRLEWFLALGLLEQVGRSYEVHDWLEYQPKDKTGAERQARFRARKSSPPLQSLREALREPLHPRERVRERVTGSNSTEYENSSAVQTEASFVAPTLRSIG